MQPKSHHRAHYETEDAAGLWASAGAIPACRCTAPAPTKPGPAQGSASSAQRLLCGGTQLFLYSSNSPPSQIWLGIFIPSQGGPVCLVQVGRSRVHSLQPLYGCNAERRLPFSEDGAAARRPWGDHWSPKGD